MGITALQERASELTQRADFQRARPFLQEILNRLSEGTAEEQATLGPVQMFVGLGFLQEYSETLQTSLLQQAVEAFTAALDYGLEGEMVAQATQLRGDANRGLGNFSEAATDYEEVLTGSLSRWLSSEEEVELLEKLSLTLYNLKDWKRAEPFYERFLNEANPGEQRALAAGLLLEAYIEGEALEKILELLPLITVDNPARYSVSLNVALMRAGDILADKSNFAAASLFYNATLTRDEIVRYWEERERLFAIRVERGREFGSSDQRLESDIYELENARLQLEAARSVQPYSDILLARVARNYFLSGRDYEAIWAYLRYIDQFPGTEIADEFEFAAFVTATKVGLENLSRRLGEEILQEASSEDVRKRVLLSLADAYRNNGDEALFIETTNEYFERFPDSPEAGQVVYMVGDFRLSRNQLSLLEEEFELLLDRMEGTPAEDGLRYWLGMALTFQGKSAEAREQFEVIVNSPRFVRSPYLEDSTYRVALSYYAGGENEKARESLRAYTEDYPRSPLRGEAEFFLGELAASAGNREDMEEALIHYSNVEKYTDSISFITSAYFQKAKLQERNGMPEEAIATYEEYIDRYSSRGQLTRAIYLLGELLREEGRAGEALIRYEDAIFEFGNDPDNLGIDSMILSYVESYEETLDKLEATAALVEKLQTDENFLEKAANDAGFLYQQFADNPDLDMSLYEEFRAGDVLGEGAGALDPYREKFTSQLENFPETPPAESFMAEFSKARSQRERTLAMRLQMALDEIGSSPNNPLVLNERDLEIASPALLVWIGQRSERIDPDLARKAYRMAINFPESVPEQLEGYLYLADLLGREGETEEAMDLYAEAEQYFPTDPIIYKAIVAQADLLMQDRDYEAAREKLQQILQVPDWRGEPHAEALYRMGHAFFEEGKFPEAHGFFERTFLGYGYFKEWAARAYLMDARTLVEMGSVEDARSTLAEALSDDRFQDTEVYNELVEYSNSI